jgi:hypothetical protein
MGILLTSLLFFAASGEPVKPVEIVPDDVIPNYLVNAGDRAEWSSAKQQDDAGKRRVQTGTSILNAPRAPSTGAGQETPEQIKQRAQKIIKEGEEQSARAMPSLERLRKVATDRYLDLTKTSNIEQPLPQTLWKASLLQSAVRLQKVARDQGYKTQHLLGSMTILGSDKIYRTPVITKALREAWVKAEPAALAPVPTGGYIFKRNPTSSVPQFSADWVTPTAAGQTALIWAEVYPLTADDAAGLLVVRIADAFTMRLVGSDVYLTTMGPAEKFPKKFTASIFLKDEKSYLQGTGVRSFDRDSNPVGVALLRDLCLHKGTLSIGASQSLYDLLGGDTPANDGAKEAWKVSPQPAVLLTRSFKVTSKGADGATFSIGELSLQLEDVSTVAKPAGK